MSSRVIRKMSLTKLSVLVFIMVAILTTVFLVKMSQGMAAPGSATDQTKVPHYFGPYPNWALSPTTAPDAAVVITGDGTGATATATVGAAGAVTGIIITNPGSGYTAATVSFTGAGTGAAATATVGAGGAVTGLTLGASGAGYTKPAVTFSGGGATTQATATAYGSVDNVILGQVGGGYTFPTVDFDMPDDPAGVQATAHATFDATTGAITGIIVDNPGSGYASAPGVVVRDGTLMDPINPGGTGATATATIKIDSVVVDTFGAGYTSAPSVAISDATGTGAGATATATVGGGAVTALNLTAGGSGYVSGTGIRKFVDALPGLCDPSGVAGPVCPATGKYIPLGVPEQKAYNGIVSDQYDIALVQYRTKFSSDLPASLVRGYVQLETPANAAVSQHFPLVNEMLDGTSVPVTINGAQAYAVTPPQWLGPTLAATKDKPVRIVFHNLLPTGSGGDLFLPTDSTMMGSGMGPMPMTDPVDAGSVLDGVRNPICSEYPKDNLGCFADNRATLHLHGGTTPWISDGTTHQWITPAGENTTWPQGVGVSNVPDMTEGNAPDDGVQTFYYTNQQSARLLFYHDHSWGITRLNVYAGEAAGYLISDDTEKSLVTSGAIPGAADTIPLIVQDRTFVPAKAQLDQQDPTWDIARWGNEGNLWYHHVYMPAQNPGDPSGMSAYGRWMYGPWFWPPATATTHGPIDNPYYDANCKLDVPSTWQYQTDPFCEPAKIPGTPNISVGMEQFNDTPIVNGQAYPTVTLEPKTYRLRMLNAANDRFFNFQWYVADPTQLSIGTNAAGAVIGGTEVALDPALLAAAQTDPTVFPTPVHNTTTAGPDWVQIGTEGGFLPAPAVVDGQQETTWITDPTRFDWGNVDKHSLVLAPAERADVIVDFSKYAGQTLILYNDAPAAYPARVPSYDYYTGAPDQSPNGAAAILPGYGPNTRTIMQVKIAGTPAPAFNMTTLRSAFTHKANGSGVFESGQHPIIVGQAAYNSAYGSSFAAGSDCNAPNSTLTKCDGYVRVNDTSSFGFNTLKGQNTKTTMPLQPKALHDEMNASTFDDFGRMTANIGVEAQPPAPGAQNVVLYPFVNPGTELIDGTNLPTGGGVYDANGNVVGDIKITPMATDGKDGTQIWRITHNGVDTHPIHFHLYDVQLVNRVTWDNIIIPTEASELGWKDTVRVSPLEDTIVALRPIIPNVPFEVPNSVRDLNPMMPEGSTAMFNNIDPQGNPTANVTNQLVNFGWEYVWHCHILSHEEMDMMRPQSLVLPPLAADGLTFTTNGTNLDLTFNDNSITETSFLVQKSTDGTNWSDVGTIDSPLNQANVHQVRTFTDTAYDSTVVAQYRVVAKNTVGYGQEFPSMTAQSISAVMSTGPAPNAPTTLTATAQAGPQVALSYIDTATNEGGFTIERAVNGGAWATLATLPANTAAAPSTTGTVSYTDTNAITPGSTYDYRVRSTNGAAFSAWSNVATVTIPVVPAAPSGLTATLQAGPSGLLQWTNNATNADSVVVERAVSGSATFAPVATLAATATTWTDLVVTAGNSYDYRVVAINTISGPSAYSNIATLVVPNIPAAPTALTATLQAGPSGLLQWTNNATAANSIVVERAISGSGNFAPVATLAATATSWTDVTVAIGATYDYRVNAISTVVGPGPYSNIATLAVPALPAAPSALAATIQPGPQVTLTWTDNANNETGFTVQRALGNGAFADIGTTAANTTTYIDTTVALGTTYRYQVRAFNLSGVSAWAGPITVAVPTLPAAPTGLTRTITRTAAGPDRVVLRWTDRSNNETGFVVQRATNAAFTANVTTFPVGANVVTYTDNVAHGQTYYYRVQAVNAVGGSAWTTSVNATTVPATPTGFHMTTANRTSIALAWTDASGNETGYQIQRRRGTTGTWTTVTTTAANAQAYTNAGRLPNTTYQYRIRGINAVGNSPWSPIITVKTLP